MNAFQRFYRMPAQPMGLLQKVAFFAVTAGVFALALVFSVLVLAAVVSIGVVAGGYFWWKMRGARKQMAQQQQQPRPPASGTVIEGVVIREVREEEVRP